MKLDLTEQELDYIMRLLMVRPYNEVSNLVPKIMRQANAQAAPVAPAPAAG